MRHHSHAAHNAAACRTLHGLELGESCRLHALEYLSLARGRVLYAPGGGYVCLMHGRVLREEAERRKGQRIRCRKRAERKRDGHKGRHVLAVGVRVLRAKARSLEPRAVWGRQLVGRAAASLLAAGLERACDGGDNVALALAVGPAAQSGDSS